MMNYFSKKKKWTAYLILLAFVFTCIVPTNFGMGNMAFAEETAADAWEQPALSVEEGTFYKDKTATALNPKDQTDVTLTVGGGAQESADVVFILGGGMTANRQTIDSAIKAFEPLMVSDDAEKNVKIGIISLEKGQEIILDLNDKDDEGNYVNALTKDNYEAVITGAFEYMNTLPAGTTNLHSQLVEAKAMLEADDTVKPENKYVFLIATGRTYWFDDAKGNQAMILSESQNGKDYAWGNFVWQQQRAVGTSYYQIPTKYGNDFTKYWEDIENWVELDGDAYIYSPSFDYAPNFPDGFPDELKGLYGSYYWQVVNQQNTCPISATNTKRMGLLIESPRPDSTKVDGITFKYNSEGGPQHALNYERAMYEAANAYSALEALNYNLPTIYYGR